MKTIDCTIGDIASKLIDKEIGAIFQGKLELGPRALGNRSIIADPRKKINGNRYLLLYTKMVLVDYKQLIINKIPFIMI